MLRADQSQVDVLIMEDLNLFEQLLCKVTDLIDIECSFPDVCILIQVLTLLMYFLTDEISYTLTLSMGSLRWVLYANKPLKSSSISSG